MRNRSASRVPTTGGSREFRNSEVVPASLSDIEPYLRAANEVEEQRPRVAYLCRFNAFEKAHRLDPTSSGRGVRQFKTALLERLEHDNIPTQEKRQRSSDAREMQSFYQQYYQNYVSSLEDAEHADRAELAQRYQTAGVLFEVLCAVNQTEKAEVAPELMEAGQKLVAKKDEYVAYNILPLDSSGSSHPIMQLPEVMAAHSAVSFTSGLSKFWSSSSKTWDTFDWLRHAFGFQRDSARNQREHLILLLANSQIRLRNPRPEPMTELDERSVDDVMGRFVKNYKKWCKFLHISNNLRLLKSGVDKKLQQQRKLLFTALYMLIWGEAANLRFTPECLCYLFHHMAEEMLGLLEGKSGLPEYGKEKDGFLNHIVSPLYDILAKEAANAGSGNAPHSSWRNYDDFNEFFWTKRCFDIGWPLKLNSAFFIPPVQRIRRSAIGPTTMAPVQSGRRIGKTGFVEHRTALHLFRDFSRMWTFFIICLQAMIITAWAGPWYGAFTNLDTFKRVSSIFITTATMSFLSALVDLGLSVGLYSTMRWTSSLRKLLRLIWFAAWVVVLSVCYVMMWSNEEAPPLVNTIQDWLHLHDITSQYESIGIYLAAVALYLVPYGLSLLLDLLPWFHRWLENSNWTIFRLLLWWSQPSEYVGRGMQEGLFNMIWYSLFWVVLLACKIAFSYIFAVKPLVSPTKQVLDMSNVVYTWPNITVGDNIGTVIVLWAPIVLVYFMDTQIWYAVISTLLGGAVGAFTRLGEIRTLDMLRARFRSLPGAFNANLVPAQRAKATFSFSRSYREPDRNTKEAARFAQLWNEVITSFREEDLISNRELDLLMVPYSSGDLSVVQWPPFLLAGKIPRAVQMAKEHNGRDSELWHRLCADEYMKFVVEECFASLQHVLTTIVTGDAERQVIGGLLKEVKKYMAEGNLLMMCRLKALPTFHSKLIDLMQLLLDGSPEVRSSVVRCLQDLFEVFTKDMLSDATREALEGSNGPLAQAKIARLFVGTAQEPAVMLPSLKAKSNGAWVEQIKRFHLLLSMREAAMEVPTNLEARRRICFFTNSLFMDMPHAPRVRFMPSFSVLTPYYNEDVAYSKQQLNEENEDGVSILFYLQKIYPDEWANFLERMGCASEDEVWQREAGERELRLWASHRGQTLSRTVRGMMYYKRAMQLQAFLDISSDEEFAAGYRAVLTAGRESKKSKSSTWSQIEAVSDLKFTYVAACQIYGQQKRDGDPRATDIFELMKSYDGLRVAYIDEVEVVQQRKVRKDFYSVLVKAYNGLEQSIYRIRLPGPAKLGEGKPENQNHAIIFTRGDALQTIDMNQDNYLEEAFKMRNLLQEFHEGSGVRAPTILGVREHIFTGSVSSLGWFMSCQETSFVTLGQRVLAWPLKVRFHYGHPDVFDRLFHITRGGISKASRGINLSEDIYAGFNTTLRGGSVTHHEYIQVGKGRDVGLNQISLFEAKVANGNGEQTLCRDLFRLGNRFDFFRMMSTYFTTVGFYVSSFIVVLTVYVFLYGRVYLALSGVGQSLQNNAAISGSSALQDALASQALVQIGLLMSLPMLMEMGLERGFRTAVVDFIIMQLQLASVFFTFSLGTKAHYFIHTILHGGAKYRATGRGFVVRHEKFAENYRLYSRSHFTQALEMLIMLIVYGVYGPSEQGAGLSYFLVTFSMWFLVLSWLFAPFVFNPSAFEWQKVVEDWEDWLKWMSAYGGIGVKSDRSWESWWEEEQEHLTNTGFMGRLVEVLFSLRFLVYQYGIVYTLNIANGSTSLVVYGISWAVLGGILIVFKVVTMGGKRLSADFQLLFRLIKAITFIAVIVAFGLGLGLTSLSVGDIFACILAFIPTGWWIILMAQALRPMVVRLGMWDSITALARLYEYLMGVVIMIPLAVLAWFPFVSEFQTRLLFNQAFSRGLQISRILAGKKK